MSTPSRGIAARVATVYPFTPELVEVSATFVPEAPRRFVAKGAADEGRQAINRERNAARARAACRRLCMAMMADRLVTLTTRANVDDLPTSAGHFRAFIKRLQQTTPGLEYVAVPERQRRGAWHWHIAVRGYVPVRFWRAVWLEIVGEGNIDVTTPRHGPRVWDQSDELPEVRTNHSAWQATVRIARYLAKYLGKTFAEPETAGRHRYRRSESITVTTVRVRCESPDVGQDIVTWATSILAGYGCKVGFSFTPDPFSIYVRSWP